MGTMTRIMAVIAFIFFATFNALATNLENKDVTSTTIGATNVKYMSNYADFSTALTLIGNTATTLVIDSGVSVTTNTATPSTLHIRVEKAGKITVANAVTLTIGGLFEAGIYQVFNCVGTGSVVFGDKCPIIYVYPQWWGAVGDYDYLSDTGTDCLAAFQGAIASVANTGATVKLPTGIYRLSNTLMTNMGIAIEGSGSKGTNEVFGSQIRFTHANDGIVFNGNSKLSRGVGTRLENLQIKRGPGYNGGDAVKIVSTSATRNPGWIKIIDVHILGSAPRTGLKGHGVHARGLVLDGVNSSIGLKNISIRNLSISGCSTNHQYVYMCNVVQLNWTDGYVIEAAYGGLEGISGITIKTNPSVHPAVKTHYILISNVVTDYLVFDGKLHAYFANVMASHFMFSGSNSEVTWVGGHLGQDITNIGTNTFNFISGSKLNIPYTEKEITADATLYFSESRKVIKNSNATTHLTVKLPDISVKYTFEFVNTNSEYNIVLDPQTRYFNGMSTGKNITLLPGAHVEVWNDKSSIRWKVLRGTAVLDGFTSVARTGYVNSIPDITSVGTITGNTKLTPQYGSILLWQPTGAHRTIYPVNTLYRPGQKLLIWNTDTAFNLIFNPAPGKADTIVPGVAKEYIYGGNDAWKLLGTY